MKPGKRASAPLSIFTLVCDTEKVKHKNTGRYMERELSAGMISVVKKVNDNWTDVKWQGFTDGDTMRNFLHLHADSKRRNYIFSPIASDSITLTGMWDYFEQQGMLQLSSKKAEEIDKDSYDYRRLIAIRRCVLKGKPDIFDYAHLGKRFIWLSAYQYIDVGDEELARSVAYTWLEDHYNKYSGMPDHRTLLQRCLLWSLVMRRMADWWLQYAKAPWGMTAGALSLGVLRTHINSKELSTHSDEETHRHERKAFSGGRASVWYLGNVGVDKKTIADNLIWMKPHTDRTTFGEAWQVDVRSFYPYLLREKEYPCKLLRPVRSMKLAELSQCLRAYGVIATVQLLTNIAEYPYRHNGRIVYPTGCFTTTLAGPELQQALDEGSIRKCISASLYEMGRPFKKAASALIDLRLDARARACHADELFAKTLAVSMGGKLAQRTGAWIDRPDVIPDKTWGEWRTINMDDNTSHHYRSICGIVQEYIADTVGKGPYTAAFAYLTSYGRQLMRQIRAQCPPYSVLQQDTDGLWVLDNSSIQQLKRIYKFGDNAGFLRVVKSSRYIRFLSPRHYLTEHGWKLAGFKDHTVCLESMAIEHEECINPAVTGTDSTPHTTRARKRYTQLSELDVGGVVSPYGWVFPLYFPPPKTFDD